MQNRIAIVTEASSDGIAWVDPAADPGSTTLARAEVGGAPWGIVVHEPTRRAYVATALGLAVVDLDARRRLVSVPYLHAPDAVEFGEERPGGTGVVCAVDGSLVYVAVTIPGENSRLERFDVADGRFIDSIEVGMRPFGIYLSRDGAELYTVDHDSFTVHTVDLASFTARVAQVSPFGTEGGLMSHQKPHYAAIDPEGRLLMPYQGRGLVTFDPRSQTYTTDPMTGDTHQHGVALTDDGRLLVVGVGAIGGASRGPSLTIRDMSTGDERVIPLERGHENVVEWVAPDGRPKALLAGGSTSQGPWDGVTIIDLETGELSEIEVAGQPQDVVLVSQLTTRMP